MKKHFNGLTPAEAERLAMLAEEAAEVVQIVGKILRHGYGSKHPSNLAGPDNRAMLHKEITDFHAVYEAMREACDLPPNIGIEALDEARHRKLRYAHHQEPPDPTS